MTDILQIRKLKKYFVVGKNADGPIYLRAVDGVSVDIHEVETFGIVGESGSGKSTIAYTVMGMYKPTAGEMIFKGQNIAMEVSRRAHHLKKELQIVFQDPGSSLNPLRSIRQLLELPLRLHNVVPPNQIEEKIVELLEKVELPPDYMYKSTPSIGGGEKQMVAIARALAAGPSFIVLDEPTSALDVSVQAKIINKLLDLQQELSLTYMFITHDLSLMRNMANRVAIMYLGRICELATAKEFFEQPLHPYTRMLLSSIPTVSVEEDRMKPKKVISIGEIPSPVNIPSGCSFHLRCPESDSRCVKEDPEMVEVRLGHWVRCHQFPSTYSAGEQTMPRPNKF
ncbi:MAG: ABC transporter ATP-binding protein [Coprothermobacterota bacterium]|nr:ABC transporter ATP-binding protein [Coprothermobacterota bacterium]